MRVDPGANSRSSKRQVGEFLGGPSDSFQRSMYLAGIALEFLAEPDRRRVLQMRPPGLDHGHQFGRFLGEGLTQVVQRRKQLLVERDQPG
jgi:hypothetical protein